MTKLRIVDVQEGEYFPSEKHLFVTIDKDSNKKTYIFGKNHEGAWEYQDNYTEVLNKGTRFSDIKRVSNLEKIMKKITMTKEEANRKRIELKETIEQIKNHPKVRLKMLF